MRAAFTLNWTAALPSMFCPQDDKCDRLDLQIFEGAIGRETENVLPCPATDETPTWPP